MAATKSLASERRCLRVFRVLFCAVSLSVAAVWLVLISELDVHPERMRHALRSAVATEMLHVDAAQQIESLLALGDRAAALAATDGTPPAETALYPEEIFEIDWATQVPRRDVLHLGTLQRACVAHNDSLVSWRLGSNSSAEPTAVERVLTQRSAVDTEAELVDELRRCATVDVYMPVGIRGQGYCEDAAVYTKHLRGRIVPDWVFKRTFFDRSRGRKVSYHELCPKTPLLVFNHYWDGLRSNAAWPTTKPLFLMPNIEMFELEAEHYLQADVVLCKTVVCHQYLTKWFAQAGNPRLTKVLYTRFTSSDVATNALTASGVEMDDAEWNERPKAFDQVAAFTHTAGTSLWKGTHLILDCWVKRPDLPMLNVYIREDFYDYGYKRTYDKAITASKNIQLHLGKLDMAAFGAMIADSAYFLCTSMMEGYGHYINHARAAGGLIVAPDGPPMNELVTPSSGVVVRARPTSMRQQFLGGTSPLGDALRGVPGFVASFSGKDVCGAVDRILKDMDAAERRRHALRARQQFFFDTAFFARKMKQLRSTLRPESDK